MNEEVKEDLVRELLALDLEKTEHILSHEKSISETRLDRIDAKDIYLGLVANNQEYMIPWDIIASYAKESEGISLFTTFSDKPLRIAKRVGS
ncbi:hypothetical protein [Paenibacillus sp. Marseille-Q4541]|uniref:hypothetical protein n=1 Tax=Paenibacillus sp. Marseille-Q4541 TaxID=2831522 RepID=UPI001BA75612|nr:hypothetical protein [Paenibacillus sp. Marseille-Q4541]